VTKGAHITSLKYHDGFGWSLPMGHSTRTERAAHRYLSAEHAVGRLLELDARYGQPAAQDPEQAILWCGVQTSGRDAPPLEDIVALKRVFAMARSRAVAKHGLVAWWVWERSRVLRVFEAETKAERGEFVMRGGEEFIAMHQASRRTWRVVAEEYALDAGVHGGPELPDTDPAKERVLRELRNRVDRAVEQALSDRGMLVRANVHDADDYTSSLIRDEVGGGGVL